LHKWIESEKAGYDIGFEHALIDWVVKYRSTWRENVCRRDASADELGDGARRGLEACSARGCSFRPGTVFHPTLRYCERNNKSRMSFSCLPFLEKRRSRLAMPAYAPSAHVRPFVSATNTKKRTLDGSKETANSLPAKDPPSGFDDTPAANFDCAAVRPYIDPWQKRACSCINVA
jgi:hypothetical protein